MFKSILCSVATLSLVGQVAFAGGSDYASEYEVVSLTAPSVTVTLVQVQSVGRFLEVLGQTELAGGNMRPMWLTCQNFRNNGFHGNRMVFGIQGIQVKVAPHSDSTIAAQDNSECEVQLEQIANLIVAQRRTVVLTLSQLAGIPISGKRLA